MRSCAQISPIFHSLALSIACAQVFRDRLCSFQFLFHPVRRSVRTSLPSSPCSSLASASMATCSSTSMTRSGLRWMLVASSTCPTSWSLSCFPSPSSCTSPAISRGRTASEGTLCGHPLFRWPPMSGAIRSRAG